MDHLQSHQSASICRLCLSDDDNAEFYDLFSPNLVLSEMLQKIRKYINLEIKEDELLAKSICNKCVDRLQCFHEFCETVISNQELMRYNQIICANETVLVEQLSVSSDLEKKTTEFQCSDSKNIETKCSDSYSIASVKNISGHNSFRESPTITLQIDLNNKECNQTEPIVQHSEEDDLNTDLDEEDFKSESDANQHLLRDEDEMGLGELFERGHQFAGFPKEMVKNGKIVVRGASLSDLLSRFFSMECDVCPKSLLYASLADLTEHYAQMHSSKSYVVCCGLKFVTTRTMAHHMARHLQPSAFQCTICKKLMTCPKNLEHHLQNHLPEKDRPLACQHCPRRFSYGSALMEHSNSHKPKNERDKYVCDECGKWFSSPGRLSTHFNLTHISQIKDFICHICARQFSSQSNLKYHLTTHQPRIHEEQCDQCGKWLKNKLCLRKHRLQHSEVKLNCDRCDYSAVSQQSLRNHKKIHHSDVKPFRCQECGKSFKLRTTLQNHIAQHTGTRNYSCEFCPRTFASSGNYYSHRKRMHPQELAAVNQLKEEEELEFRAKLMDKRSQANNLI